LRLTESTIGLEVEHSNHSWFRSQATVSAPSSSS
jgi:hypothetical protein